MNVEPLLTLETLQIKEEKNPNIPNIRFEAIELGSVTVTAPRPDLIKLALSLSDELCTLGVRQGFWFQFSLSSLKLKAN